MSGVSGFWFVNDGIDGDALMILLILWRKPAKKKRILKEIHSSSVKKNNSERHLNDKNPSQELSPRKEKLSHDRSNNIESKNMMCHSRADKITVSDPPILATWGEYDVPFIR